VINLAWDHNSYYQPRLLRALPDRCERVLDVGCGKGEFAIRLAERAGRVDAVDRSATMIETARRVVPANVTCLQGDVAAMTLPAGAYDAITSISSLPAGRRYRREMYRRLGEGPAMPIMDPVLTIRDVRQQAERALPGATVRRLVLWRYELRWRKPQQLLGQGDDHADGRGRQQGGHRPAAQEEQ